MTAHLMVEKRAHTMRGSASRLLRVGCFGLLLGFCGLLGVLAVALQSGPVSLGLPGRNIFKFGSDSFVLSNYSFQQGTTYYLDLDGNGVRNILQFQYLPANKSFEIVFHHAGRDTIEEHKLATVSMP